MSNRWLGFIKYLLIPVTAFLAGMGLAIYHMMGAK